MRIQFLVAAHRDPEFVWRLCERLLDAPDAAVTVQWDCAFELPEVPAGLRVDVRATRAPCGWGNGSQLDALLDSLRALERSRFDWLVVLSGQDYPIRPMGELASFLADTRHSLFLQTPEGGSVPAPPAEHGEDGEWAYLQDRYFYRYRWVPQGLWAKLGVPTQRVISGGLQHVVRFLVPGGAVRVQRRPGGFSPAIGVRVRRHPFTADRPCRKGSDWFAISRPVFDDLLDRAASAPTLVEYFRHTYLPTESFFHTVLLPYWESDNADHNLHFRRFVPGHAHPEVLREADWDELVASHRFFARKFDPPDVAVVDRIDRDLLT